MRDLHPKSVRGRFLRMLYERYMQDPLDMASPEDLLEDGAISRKDLVTSAYYLHDRGLIELMIGYNPPMFAAARITADGIDLVENEFEFTLRFPPEPGHAEQTMANIPYLIERLVEEADFAPLDGENRNTMLKDVQYLRDELARPVERWRIDMIETVCGWIERAVPNAEEHLPSLAGLKQAIGEKRRRADT